MADVVHLKVRDLHCEHCVKSVKDAISGVRGTKNVKVDLKKSMASFEMVAPATLSEITKAIEDAGYEVEQQA